MSLSHNWLCNPAGLGFLGLGRKHVIRRSQRLRLNRLPQSAKRFPVPVRILLCQFAEILARSYPFEQVQELVERKVLIDRYNKVLDQLNAELMEEAKLGEADEFVDFCLKEIYLRARQQ